MGEETNPLTPECPIPSLTAACERLADIDIGLYQGPTGDDADMRAAIMLARWAKPLLDETPISESWLRSVGAENSGASCYFTLPQFPSDCDLVKWSGGWNFRTHHGINCRTRGELRALIAALGGKLQEPTK